MDQLKPSSQIPFITTMTAEQGAKLEERYGLDEMDFRSKQNRITKSYNNTKKKTNIRQVGEFLFKLVHKKGTNCITSYSEISKTLNIPKSSVKICVTDLNFWEGHPFTWIPVPKKKEHIQNVLKNELDYEKWDRKKGKTIMSMEGVKLKAEKIAKPKQRKRRKVKIKVKNENNKKKSEM